MGRFGRTASKPINELITVGGGAFPKTIKRCLKCREDFLLIVAPRLIVSSKQDNAPNLVRICSDATVDGGLAS